MSEHLKGLWFSALLALVGACRTQTTAVRAPRGDTGSEQGGPICDLGAPGAGDRPVMVLVNGRRVSLLRADGVRRDVAELQFGDTQQGVATIVTAGERAGVRLWGGLGQLAAALMIDASGRLVWRDDRNLPTRGPWFLDAHGVSVLSETTIENGRVDATTQVIPVDGGITVIPHVQALGPPVRGHVPAVQWHEAVDEDGHAYLDRVGWLRLLSAQTRPLGASVLHSAHTVVVALGARMYHLAERPGPATLVETTVDASREVPFDYGGDPHALVLSEPIGGRWFVIAVRDQRAPFWRVDGSNGTVTRVALEAPPGTRFADATTPATLTEDGQVVMSVADGDGVSAYRSADGRTGWTRLGQPFQTTRALRVVERGGGALIVDRAADPAEGPSPASRSLQVVRAAEGAAHAIPLPAGSVVGDVRWTRDGRCVAWVERAGDQRAVRVMDVANGHRRTLVPVSEGRPNVAVAWW